MGMRCPTGINTVWGRWAAGFLEALNESNVSLAPVLQKLLYCPATSVTVNYNYNVDH